MKYDVVSADDHVVEPADCYTRRVPHRMVEQVPRVQRIDDKDAWFVQGKKVGAVTALTGVPTKEADISRVKAESYDTILPGSYRPIERLQDYDRDGIDAGVLFPNAAGFAGDPLWYVKDLEVRLACIQAYNDWLLEDFCNVDPARLIGLAILPSWNVEAACAEARRAVKNGYKGIIFCAALDIFGQPATFLPYWDPLWATIQDLNVPVCFHQLSRASVRPTFGNAVPDGMTGLRIAEAIWCISSLVQVLPELIFAGIPERFPRLKIFLAEGGVGWIPFVLSQADYLWERHRDTISPRLTMPPSDYWRRQFSAGFWSEPVPPSLTEYLGPHTILWEADYPHSLTTYPNSQQHIAKSLASLTDPAVRRQIIAGNSERLFQIG